MVAFHASTLGMRLLNGRAFPPTLSGWNDRPLGPTQGFIVGIKLPSDWTPAGSVMGLQLFASTCAGVKLGGPVGRVKAMNPGLSLRDCCPNTGRFCVMKCPKIEPNT